MPALLSHTDNRFGNLALRAMAVLCFWGALGGGAKVRAQATDLIISQYLEGSFGNNKYLELYNGTSTAINLADYQLRLYSNGTTTPTTAALTGSLPAGGTIVYGNSAGTIYSTFTSLNTICAFSGDDAVALYKISTASFVDIFGNIGNDPGTAWTSGSLSTADQSLVRNPNICSGVTVDPTGTGALAFTTLGSEWANAGTDDVSDLGSHTMTCGPTVNFSAATSSALENVGTAQTITMSIAPAATGAGSITITIGGTSTATYGAGNDYTSPAAVANVITVPVTNGATSASFDIYILDDAITEGDETIDFTITGATAGLSIGSSSSHTFTILNDDVTPTINFSTLNITVLENAGMQVFQMSFLPTTHPSGTVTITISGTSTATYGADYTTNSAGGDGSLGSFTMPFGNNATTATFSATVINDVLPESTENVIFTITAVSAGFAIGSNNTATLVIGDNDSPPAVLAAGDLVVVGVNANDNACDGDPVFDYDYVSFFCFQEITYGTELILTDNGYERCNAGQWGNQEGTVRMKRTGPGIPAGQVITFRIKAASGPTNVSSVAPDAGWSCTPIGISGTSIALNKGGDQLFFMQGGIWSPGTSLNNNATYTGTILYAFSTNQSPPWTASCNTSPNQRSNLPPGIQCFSMAPTGASDFSKYTGPLTLATQRDWIIRVSSTANWSSYSSCTAYAANGTDWLTAPILPIIPGGMTHGLWRGATNTDWFECKNWDDARIPDATTDVVITDGSAIQNCVVGMATGLNPGGTAVCASLLQDFSTATVRNLTVAANSTLTIGGELTVQHSAGAGTVLTEVLNNASLNADSVNIRGFTTGADQARLQAISPGSTVNVSGNVRIGPGGYLNLQNTATNFGTLNLGGNFINQEDETHFADNYSTVRLNGAADQHIQNSDPLENFYNLHINKTGGDVYLTAPIAIRNQLNLTQGRIFSSTGAMITVNSGAAVIGTSDASFVHGPITKVGNSDFTFPVGKGNSYRPASVTAISGGTGDAFTGEYFAVDPDIAIGHLVLPTTLHHISHCEYWTIDRSAGTPNAKVTLTWDTPESCEVTSGALGELRVARWTGSNWDDRGNGGTTGTATAGTIVTPIQEPNFSPWTLASATENNPLPIQLLSFTARPGNGVVDLAWSTASEQNNAHFTVERSTDAQDFSPVLEVPGAGNSQGVLQYSGVDPSPLPGLSYYRLRQTDFDGSATTSAAVPVFFRRAGIAVLGVYYGSDQLLLAHDFAPGSLMEVLDLTGRLISRQVISGPGLQPIATSGLARGSYVLRVSDGSRTESTQFVW